jgi:hypothetical protein
MILRRIEADTLSELLSLYNDLVASMDYFVLNHPEYEYRCDIMLRRKNEVVCKVWRRKNPGKNVS